MALSLTQEKIVALVPKLTGGLGVPSAMTLIILIYRDQKKGTSNPMLRALLSMAFYELFDAMAWFLSTWAVPVGSFAFAAGNQATCSFQGFWLQFVIGAPLSSVTLAGYCYMVVIRNKSIEAIAFYEYYVLGMIFVYAILTSIVLLLLGQYNHVGTVCWVQGSPPQCGNSVFGGGGVPCDRGDWAWVFGMVLFYLPLWICYCCILFFNGCIYRKMGNTPDSSWFRTQSLLYSLAFCLTWAPSTLWSALQWRNGGAFWIDLLSAIFEPLAAFWNLLIYLRNHPSDLESLRKVITCTCGLPDDASSSVSGSTDDKKSTHSSVASEAKNDSDVVKRHTSRMDKSNRSSQSGKKGRSDGNIDTSSNMHLDEHGTREVLHESTGTISSSTGLKFLIEGSEKDLPENVAHTSMSVTAGGDLDDKIEQQLSDYMRPVKNDSVHQTPVVENGGLDVDMIQPACDMVHNDVEIHMGDSDVHFSGHPVKASREQLG